MTLNFSEARPSLFPANRSQVEKGNERRVTDVKGAERKTFQRLSRGVFTFILCLLPELIGRLALEICTKSENLNPELLLFLSRLWRFHVSLLSKRQYTINLIGLSKSRLRAMTASIMSAYLLPEFVCRFPSTSRIMRPTKIIERLSRAWRRAS